MSPEISSESNTGGLNTEERVFRSTINISVLEHENETSHSITKFTAEYPSFTASIDTNDRFFTPSLYKFEANDNYEDRNLYISGSAKYGGPNYVFSEPTGAMIIENRKSEFNQEYRYFYTSSDDFDRSSRFTSNRYLNFYTSKSLVESDKDPEYQNVLSLNRSFYEGVKNTKDTTLDGDLPIIIRTSAPTVATPTNFGISGLQVDDENP